MGTRHRIWDLLEVTYDPETCTPLVDWYDKSLAILIVLNVLAVIVASVEAIELAYARFFQAFEILSVAILRSSMSCGCGHAPWIHATADQFLVA